MKREIVDFIRLFKIRNNGQLTVTVVFPATLAPPGTPGVCVTSATKPQSIFGMKRSEPRRDMVLQSQLRRSQTGTFVSGYQFGTRRKVLYALPHGGSHSVL